MKWISAWKIWIWNATCCVNWLSALWRQCRSSRCSANLHRAAPRRRCVSFSLRWSVLLLLDSFVIKTRKPQALPVHIFVRILHNVHTFNSLLLIIWARIARDNLLYVNGIFVFVCCCCIANRGAAQLFFAWSGRRARASPDCRVGYKPPFSVLFQSTFSSPYAIKMQLFSKSTAAASWT